MSSKSNVHVEVVGVSHLYRRANAPALKDVSFSIGRGEAVALVGRSGCGKSTILHILAGLTMPSSGTVQIDGERVAGPSPRWIVMFQQPHLYPWMTVEQNVGLGLKFAGRHDEIQTRVPELLRLVELENFAERNVQDLSGGQAQRVALARSLVLRPDVLLLDEPFSALDAVTRRALQRDVRRIASEFGITLVVVTHDIPEAVAMADRALVMSNGRLHEEVPIRVDLGDRERRGPITQRIQADLQTAFERVSGRLIAPVPEAGTYQSLSREPVAVAAR